MRALIFLALLCACIPSTKENDMALPTSRNTTYIANAQVKSVDLNAIQDKIIDNNARLNGDVTKPAVVLGNAITAPDFRTSASRKRVIHPSAGYEATLPAGAREWFIGSVVSSTVSGAATFVVPVAVESGETITVTANCSQSVAVGAGSVSLTRIDNSGTPAVVAVVAIGTATGAQQITVVTGHAVVTGSAYEIGYSFGSGAGTKLVWGTEVDWVR